MGIHFRRFMHLSDPSYPSGAGLSRTAEASHHVHWWLLLVVLVVLLMIAVGSAGS